MKATTNFEVSGLNELSQELKKASKLSHQLESTLKRIDELKEHIKIRVF